MMKKPELLSPCGNMESLIAATLAGCDAVYLGGYQFGARSFAGNFSNEELIEAITYAHLYGVKVYVTVNTLVYENEVPRFLEYIEFLHKHNVDAVIIQDLGMMDLIHQMYPNLEIHASTQMHIHNIDGVLWAQNQGIKRAVVARETSIDTIREMKKHCSIELEVFVHGALCVSYSGQCFMSYMIGGRSGNRGTCAQCCRQKYRLVDSSSNIVKESSYLLSMKDLNTLSHIGELIEAGVDSLKIEGRMKRPEYVYLVTSLYRKAIDSYIEKGKVEVSDDELEQLKKMFHRGFTKGFLFHESPQEIVHSYRPNHIGIPIGEVVSNKKGFVSICLCSNVHREDGIRFLMEPEDLGFVLNRMYQDGKLVDHAVSGDIIEIPIKTKVPLHTNVVKTSDILDLKTIHHNLKQFQRKVPIKGTVVLKENCEIELTLFDGINKSTAKSKEKLEHAKTKATTKEQVITQLSKLGDTVYHLEELHCDMDDSLFIPVSLLNEVRREAVCKLNEMRCYQIPYIKKEYLASVPTFSSVKEYTVRIQTLKQYEILKDKPFTTFYIPFNETKENTSNLVSILPRIMDTMPMVKGPVMVGDVGGLYHYNDVITDFGIHVTNSYTLAFLHRNHVSRVTLSYELNDVQLKELMNAYITRYHTYPNVEWICYGEVEVMITRYQIPNLKKEEQYVLRDRFHNDYPIQINENGMILYHYQKLVKTSLQKYFDMGINYIRYQVRTQEDLEFVRKIDFNSITQRKEI